ncbi:hypothetical protein AB0G76_31765 [Streptomyces asoensis]|uniref:hypothetical protein n=2 Tax=Streptomyces asoensis TaxID=249586 RepID=UPI0033CDD4CB
MNFCALVVRFMSQPPPGGPAGRAGRRRRARGSVGRAAGRPGRHGRRRRRTPRRTGRRGPLAYPPLGRAAAPVAAPTGIVLVPYHSWARRGPSTMRVWLPTAGGPQDA